MTASSGVTGVGATPVANRHETTSATARDWQRYAWAAGIIYVIALVAESVVAVGVGLTQNDSAGKMATGLYEHRTRLVVIACLSVVYTASFLIYLWSLYNQLRGTPDRPRILAPLVLAGGVLFVALHAVSDIGITGLVGAKLAAYGAQHDHSVSYSLYLTTYAFDSVADVFGSLFALATGLIVLSSRVLPRWLGWIAIGAGLMFFLQAFGLGGVIASFGLVLDIIGFVLFLIFVLASSIIFLRRQTAVPETAAAAIS
jgi:Domain of unknown function (DUF4386)